MEAAKIYSLIDLTSLNESDTEQDIVNLCKLSQNSLGHVAAICVYPKFIPLVKQNLSDASIKIATVINFPEGMDQPQAVIDSIKDALLKGADEIDVVFPYKKYLSGDKDLALDLIAKCKEVSKTKTLKVILETGALKDLKVIQEVSAKLIDIGVDFLKTSTGKIPTGATKAAVQAMVAAIKNNKKTGLKISGGVKTVTQVEEFIGLVVSELGNEFIDPKTFRIGASSLVKNIS